MNSRQKGARGERELAKVLTSLGFPARRGVQYSGLEGKDVVAPSLHGLHIECKRVQRLNLDAAMQQSVRDARHGEVPVVMHRRDHHEWMVTVHLDQMILFAQLLLQGQETSHHPSETVEELATDQSVPLQEASSTDHRSVQDQSSPEERQPQS